MTKTSTNFRMAFIGIVASAILIFAGTTLAKPPEGKAKPGKPGPLNILEVALAVNGMAIENEDEGVGEFAYLLGAVECLPTDDQDFVVGLLTGPDKHTLFAPTNQAFRDLQVALGITETAPEETCAVDDALGSGTLFTVLAYHLTEGRRFSNSVFNKNQPKDIEMLAGGFITSMPNLSIIDGAYRMVGLVPSLINVNASNGVIHTIDTVMLPFDPFAAE